MKMLLLFLIFFTLAKAQECLPCDPSCGDWSCITNCSQSNPPSNPTFDVPRCFNDLNGNQILDDCRELPACVYMNNQYVCPLDVRDPVCSGSCVYSGAYGDIKYYDTNPRDFDSVFYTYAKSRGF